MEGRAGRRREPAAASKPSVNLKHPICLTWDVYLRYIIHFKIAHVCDNLETKQQVQMVSSCIFVLFLSCVVASMEGRAAGRREPAAASKPSVNLKHVICLIWDVYLRYMTHFKFAHVRDNLETKQQVQMVSN